MNTNDNRYTKTEKTAFKFARRAAVLALPLGLLVATAAAPAQAAGDVPNPGQGNVPVPANAPAIPVNVPIASTGAEFTFDDWEAQNKTSSTGPLEGQVTLAETADGVAATDLLMFNPVGEEGDLGQVRVTSVDPVTPDASATKQPEASATQQYVIAFEIEALPGHNAPVVVQTAPLELKAAAEATDIKAFPPVNQQYSLQESVELYQQQDSKAGSVAIGQLEGFDVIVNQSA